MNRNPKIKLWRMCLSDNDFAAMDFLMTKYCFGTRTNAVRFSLRNQAERDRQNVDSLPATLQSNYVRILETCKGMLLKSKRFGPEEVSLHQWSCWLEPKAHQQMAFIKKRWGLEHKAEALRFALRAQAELDGFLPNGGVW